MVGGRIRESISALYIKIQNELQNIFDIHSEVNQCAIDNVTSKLNREKLGLNEEQTKSEQRAISDQHQTMWAYCSARRYFKDCSTQTTEDLFEIGEDGEPKARSSSISFRKKSDGDEATVNYKSLGGTKSGMSLYQGDTQGHGLMKSDDLAHSKSMKKFDFAKQVEEIKGVRFKSKKLYKDMQSSKRMKNVPSIQARKSMRSRHSIHTSEEIREAIAKAKTNQAARHKRSLGGVYAKAGSSKRNLSRMFWGRWGQRKSDTSNKSKGSLVLRNQKHAAK